MWGWGLSESILSPQLHRQRHFYPFEIEKKERMDAWSGQCDVGLWCGGEAYPLRTTAPVSRMGSSTTSGTGRDQSAQDQRKQCGFSSLQNITITLFYIQKRDCYGQNPFIMQQVFLKNAVCIYANLLWLSLLCYFGMCRFNLNPIKNNGNLFCPITQVLLLRMAHSQITVSEVKHNFTGLTEARSVQLYLSYIKKCIYGFIFKWLNWNS